MCTIFRVQNSTCAAAAAAARSLIMRRYSSGLPRADKKMRLCCVRRKGIEWVVGWIGGEGACFGVRKIDEFRWTRERERSSGGLVLMWEMG